VERRRGKKKKKKGRRVPPEMLLRIFPCVPQVPRGVEKGGKKRRAARRLPLLARRGGRLAERGRDRRKGEKRGHVVPRVPDFSPTLFIRFSRGWKGGKKRHPGKKGKAGERENGDECGDGRNVSKFLFSGELT